MAKRDTRARAADWRLKNLLDELQWVVYRLFGVHSQVFGPGLDGGLSHWGFHRPWFCFFLHEPLPSVGPGHPLWGLDRRCNAATRRLMLAGRCIRAGVCAMGLRQICFTVPLPGGGHWRILLGPYLPRRFPERWFWRAVRRIRYPNPQRLHWGFRQLPLVDRRHEGRMVMTVRRIFLEAAARFGRLVRRGTWEGALGVEVESVYPPLRTGDDMGANIYAIFVEFHEGRPPVLASEKRSGMYELDYVRRGRALVRSGGKEFIIGPGGGCLNLPGEPLEMVPSGGEGLSTVAMSFTGNVPLCVRLAGRPLAFSARHQALLSELCALAVPGQDPSHRSTPVKMLLVNLLLGLESPAQPGRGEGPVPTFERNRRRFLANRIRDYIEVNQEEKLTPHRLTEVAGVSITTMYRMFSKEMGMSPMQYYTRQRINRALQFLKETDMNVSEVSERLHFSNPFHFSRVFRRVTGQPPAKYAREVRFETEPEAPGEEKGRKAAN